MKRKIRFFFSDFWRLARERRQRQGPALLRVLRNSPRAIPLPGLLHGCLVLIIVVSQNVILSVKTRLLPDKLLISNNLSVKPHLFTDKLSILSQPYSVSVIRAYTYMIKTVRGPQRFSNRFLLRSCRLLVHRDRFSITSGLLFYKNQFSLELQDCVSFL